MNFSAQNPHSHLRQTTKQFSSTYVVDAQLASCRVWLQRFDHAPLQAAYSRCDASGDISPLELSSDGWLLPADAQPAVSRDNVQQAAVISQLGHPGANVLLPSGGANYHEQSSGSTEPGRGSP